jgi:branched-chain amino acid transport system ATP-binding protein
VTNALRTAAQDTTVILVEQNLAVATHLATDAVVLDQGRVVHTGSMKALADDAELTGRFLGVEVR